MIIITRGWLDLVKGYNYVLEAEAQLRAEWEPKLKVVDSLNRKRYEEEMVILQRWQAEENEKESRHQQAMAAWSEATKPVKAENAKRISDWQTAIAKKSKELNATLWVAVIGAIVSVTIVLACISFPIALAALFYYFVTKNDLERLARSRPELAPIAPEPQREPRAPKPVVSEVRSASLALCKKWFFSLGANVLQQDTHQIGNLGENEFMGYLFANLPDAYIGLIRIPVTHSLDADIIVIAPTGIWILESKYWSGTITLRQGQWRRVKDFYARGGIPCRTEEFVDSFDEEWLREKDAIAKMLKIRLRSQPWLLSTIKGGLVFTHHKVELIMDDSCKVDYGLQEDWIEKIQSSPTYPGFTLPLQFKIAQIFLDYAHTLKGGETRSAFEMADGLREKMVTELERYVSQYGGENNL